MGYHLTILRTFQGKKDPILLDEAMAAARDIGGWNYTASPPTFELRKIEGDCTLWHQGGELWAKTPESWELEHILALAKRLNARVRGDEFETYDSTDKTYLHPDDLLLRKEAEAQSKTQLSASMREQRLIRNSIVGVFLVLGIIGYFVGRWFETQ